MGAVYRARDLELDEVIAVKMLHASVGQSSAMLDRLRREVRLARRVFASSRWSSSRASRCPP
jgi:serine/threonine-protein kinase